MIRLAILGEGNKAAAYASAASRLRSIEVVAAANGDHDAVAVTSSVKNASEIISHCATAGQHMLIDFSLESAIELADKLGHRNGARLMIGGSLRFAPSHSAVKESLTSGKLGTPGLLRVHRWRKGADALPVTRELDLAHWLFGAAPDEIYATHAPGYVQMHLGFPDGGMALIDVASAIPSGDDYFSLCMIGSTGAAYADDHHNQQLLYRGDHPQAIKTGQGCTHLVEELGEFAAAIEQRREPSITVADARVASQVAAAVKQSIDSGRALRLAEGNYDFV